MKKKANRGTQMCLLSDILFPVELRDNPRNTNREYSKVVTGIIGGKEMDLNYCSPIYELVPNEAIFPKVEEIFNDHNIRFRADYSHTNNTRFYGNYIIEDPAYAYHIKGTKNDIVKFKFDFQHSYNGLTKYKGLAGFYRLVCTNGLVIPVAEMNEYNLVLEGKHTASIMKSLERFSEILTNLTNNLNPVKNAIGTRFDLLGGHWIAKPEDRIAEVLMKSGITAVSNSKFNTVGHILKTIKEEANDKRVGYNGRVNDWLIYNGINQYLNDDDLNITAPEKRRENDSKVLEYMLETVNA